MASHAEQTKGDEKRERIEKSLLGLQFAFSQTRTPQQPLLPPTDLLTYFERALQGRRDDASAYTFS